MKKFKSLMLAALASAALAAPSFADGHGNGIAAVTGQFQASMTYSSVSKDNDDTVTTQNTSPGVQKINFAGDNYDFYWEEDGGSSTKLKLHDTITSGDNSVSGFAEFASPFSGPTIGDVYIKGANKTLSLQVGKFGTSNAYSNGLGESRAKVSIGADDTIFGEYEENLDIPGFRGLQANITAGDVAVEVAVPWMNESAAANVLVLKSKKATNGNAIGDALSTNITGVRPKITLGLGSVNVTALVYSLSFSTADAGDEPDEKTSSGFQLMGNVQAGAAKLELGYTSQERKDGAGDAITPNVMNGAVTVALGGGQNVGASFDMINDGKEDDTTATRLAATYQTPFFVEAVTLSLGIGTATQKTNDDVNGVAGSASSAEAKWTYAF